MTKIEDLIRLKHSLAIVTTKVKSSVDNEFLSSWKEHVKLEHLIFGLV